MEQTYNEISPTVNNVYTLLKPFAQREQEMLAFYDKPASFLQKIKSLLSLKCNIDIVPEPSGAIENMKGHSVLYNCLNVAFVSEEEFKKFRESLIGKTLVLYSIGYAQNLEINISLSKSNIESMMSYPLSTFVSKEQVNENKFKIKIIIRYAIV